MVEAEHMCMTMRGIKKPGSKTITTVAQGLYKEDREERKEILSLMQTLSKIFRGSWSKGKSLTLSR